MRAQDEAILVVGGEGLTRSELTAELSRAKTSIAKLRAGLGEDEFIPMIVDNSMNSHIALLAAADMGANVAVIDATVKPDQLTKILGNFDSAVAIVANPEMRDIDSLNPQTFRALERESGEDSPHLAESSLGGSVVVFSSGSTSDPKGVILHWNDLVRWTTIRHGIPKDSVDGELTVLNLSPVSWVLGLLNLVSVLVGARLATIDVSQFSPGRLLSEVERLRPNYVSIPANLAQIVGIAAKEWKSKPVDSIQQFMIGSGKVSWETVNLFSRFVPQTATFTHNLSATEALRMFNVKVPFSELPRSGQVPLGIPRDPENIRLEPTDDDNTFEVFAAGDIAVGYVNRQKSLESFARDESGKLWWKSGELVRIDRQTGDYFHAGRIDNLVKVNDHNVLLDDIESLIQSHPGIRMVAVVPVHVKGRTRLVAFVSWDDVNTSGESAIVDRLRDQLPNYAMPHHVMNLSEFPLTRSGKIDRAALGRAALSRFA